MWAAVRDHYCFFDEKATDWDRVRDEHRPRAQAAADERALIVVLEQALDQLYDPHTHLGVNLSTSWRLAAHDVWAEWKGDAAVVTAVRRGSVADREHVRPGDVIVTIDGQLPRAAADARMPTTLRVPDPEARGWALRSALSGRHDRDRVWELRDPKGETRTVTLAADAERRDPVPAVNWRRIRADIGYVRVADFGPENAIAAFDRALDDLRDTRALLIDVRDNPGGDTAVARPIMGRFVTERLPYAKMARREGEGLGSQWVEHVDPRGWTYRGGVVVLVDRFSVSMAEGFAMGMDGMGRATVVGTRMAGLGAGLFRAHLEHIDADVQLSAEPVYHVDGTPRWKLVPKVLVEQPWDHLDPILDAGLKLAEQMVADGAPSSLEP